MSGSCGAYPPKNEIFHSMTESHIFFGLWTELEMELDTQWPQSFV